MFFELRSLNQLMSMEHRRNILSRITSRYDSFLNRRVRALVCLLIVHMSFVIVAHSEVLAQVPRVISYQGRIQNGGTDLAGTHNFVLSLYDQSGTKLWTESQAVIVTGGIFNILLGSSTAFPSTLDFSRQYFLGISIDGGAELTPQTPFESAPYALHASTADALSSTPSGVVTTLNTLSGSITLAGAGGTTVTPNGSTITISSSGGGGTGIQGVQSLDGSITISNPNGPTANIQLPSSIPLSKISTTGASSGSVLTYSGGALQYMSPVGLTLPYAGANSSSSDAFKVTTSTDSRAGYFLSSGASSDSAALVGESRSSSSAGVIGRAPSFGVAGYGGSGYNGIYGAITSNGVSAFQANAGVSGYSNHGAGVAGISGDSSNPGIFGYSNYGIGMQAISNYGLAAKITTTYASDGNPALLVSAAGSGPGVDASSNGGPGVRASFSGSGAAAALEVSNGAIKVSGAQQSAFVQIATAGNITGNYTTITNSLTDGDPSAMLFVTPLWLASSGVYCNFPIGVFYITTSGHWAIFNQNGAGSVMPLNAQFNVLVIKH
jgi:hypothetical protein